MIAITLIANIALAAFSFWFGTGLAMPSDFLARQDAAHGKLEQYFQANAVRPEKIKDVIYGYEEASNSSQKMQANLAKAFTALGTAHAGISLLLFFCLIMTLWKKAVPL